MRRSASLISIALGAVLVAPLAAHASVIPFWGPIVPNLTCGSGATYQISPLAWGALIPIINNIIAFALTIAIMFILPLIIAYGGFLYLTSGANPSNRSKANSAITNAIIGIIVALAAWIIVDSVMGALYNGSAGAWYSVITSGGGDPCLTVAGSLNSVTLPNGQQGTVLGYGPNGQTYTSGTGACDPDALQQADPGISQQEAKILACIAQPESSCGANTGGATTPGGQATSASGPFQIVFGAGNDSCHNLNVPQCESLNSGQPLNCHSYFSGGKPKAGYESQANECIKAANTLSCATAAADCLVQADHGYSAWTADPRSSAQQACVSRGGS
jgi:hypothetical protein